MGVRLQEKSPCLEVSERCILSIETIYPLPACVFGGLPNMPFIGVKPHRHKQLAGEKKKVFHYNMEISRR
jgi:hypothetical protein